MLRRGGSPQRLLTTVLFTDIVGSTERAAQLGDRGWKDLVARHHAIVRRELRRFHGRELDTAGDGFFASFERPAQAIECATAIIDALRPLDLDIRAAVHMGEAEVMGGKVGGITVHVASRALAQAGPGEILTTSTVREVTAGADVTFEDRGVHEFKGVPGEWRLYAVQWQRRPLPATGAGAAELPVRGPFGRRGVAVLVIAAAVAITVTVPPAIYLATRAGPTPTSTPLVAAPNSAVELDPATGAVLAVVPAGDSPTGIAIGDGTVWFVSLGDKVLTAVPAGGGAPRSIGLPGSPTGIAAGSGSVWITFGFGAAGESGGVVWRISAITQRQEQSIAVGNGATAVAVGEGAVWVANGVADQLIRIDPQTRAIVGRLGVAEEPVTVAVGEGSVWVAHLVSRTVWRIDLAASGTPREIALRDAPASMAVGFGRVWITSDSGNSLTVIDTETNGLVTTIPIDEGPRGVAAGAGAVWVAGSRGALLRVDPGTLTVSDTVILPGPAEGVAATDASVWVTVQQ